MRKFSRAEEPGFLAARWGEWGKEWERRKAEGGSFHWHQIDGVSVDRRLMPILKAQTQDHCSFCDNFPISPPSPDTVEHFRPKSTFPREAYHWKNLYYCCAWCQKHKLDKFDEAVLRPDAEDYAFDRYFRWDWTQGLLLVNDQASPDDQHRAAVTIELYGLNEGHPVSRKRGLRLWSKESDGNLREHPYRDYLRSPEAGSERS